MADAADPLPKVEFAGGYGSSYPHRGHYARNVVVAVLALIGTSVSIHPFLPLPEMLEITPKLRYFTAHKDEFDTVFVGSSHIYRDVVPQTFDRVTSASAFPTHSFNFGIGGMQPPESLYFLEEILRAHPPNLKWVFLELEEVQPRWPRPRWQTHRFYYWHNWRSTLAAIEGAIDPERRQPWWKQLWSVARSQTAGLHLLVFLKNTANVSAASNFSQKLTGYTRSTSPNQNFDDTRGFLLETRRMSDERVKIYLEDLERRTRRAHSRAVDLVTDDLFRHAAELIQAAGAQPIFVIPPGQGETELSFRGPKTPPGPVLAFNSAGKYAELYGLTFRADEQHLKPEGAEIFSRLLAEHFVNEMAADHAK